MKLITLLLVLMFGGAALAQVPRPYAVGSLDLNNGGYQPLSETIGVGLNAESAHFIGNAEAAYENARKTNDGTVGNTKGHERFLRGTLFGKLNNGFYFGGGARWTQTSTTLYTKQGYNPLIGGGKDFLRDDFSFRLQALYAFKGNDKLNGVQGAEFSFYIPSPATKGHFFFREVIAVDRFHSTITSPELAAAESATYHTAAYVSSGVVIRF
jgi:hypothetical protein